MSAVGQIFQSNKFRAAAMLLALLVTVSGFAWYAGPSGLGSQERADESELARGFLPTPQPLVLKPLSREEALSENSAIPFSTEPVEAAFGFVAHEGPQGDIDQAAALECLTAAIYYEAASEDVQGQRAVAQVVLNRVRHRAFPASVCDVVLQGSDRTTGCQFTFTCDGSLARRPSAAGWKRAKAIAQNALQGAVERSVGMATHYHANYVVPYWAPSLAKIAAVGTHIFYRWQGSWGRRLAFTQRYAGEGSAGSLRNEALMAGTEDQLVQPLIDVERFDPLAGAAPSSLQAALARHTPVMADERPGNLAADEERSSLIVDGAATVLSAAERGLNNGPTQMP